MVLERPDLHVVQSVKVLGFLRVLGRVGEISPKLLGTVFRLGVETSVSFFWWVCHAVSHPCKHGHHVVKGKLRSVGADLLSPLL